MVGDTRGFAFPMTRSFLQDIVNRKAKDLGRDSTTPWQHLVMSWQAGSAGRGIRRHFSVRSDRLCEASLEKSRYERARDCLLTTPIWTRPHFPEACTTCWPDAIVQHSQLPQGDPHLRRVSRIHLTTEICSQPVSPGVTEAAGEMEGAHNPSRRP